METKEIIKNEEVIEMTEEIVEAGSGNTLKLAAGLGIGVIVCGVAYTYIVKPAIAKYKAKKNKLTIAPSIEDGDDEDCSCSEEI